MKNRIAATALAVCLMASWAPVSALAADAVPVGSWQFKELLPCEYDQINWPDWGTVEVKRDGRWGVIDTAGKPVVACQYAELGRVFVDYDTTQTLFAAKNAGGKWGLIDEGGDVVVPFAYDDMESSYQTYDVDGASRLLLRVKKDGKQGFIDQTGAAVIPLSYSDARNFFFGGCAAVANDQGLWGVIDVTGTQVIDFQYRAVGGFEDSDSSLVPVQRTDGTWEFIDETGATQITCQGSYDWVDGFRYQQELAVVTRGRKQGLIDREGKEVMPCQYDAVMLDWTADEWMIYGNQKTYAGGETGWEYGLRRGDGTVDTGLIYEQSWELDSPYFAQGLFPVSRLDALVNGVPTYLYGYIDETGREVIPCRYDYAEYFSGGLAAVELEGRAGFIDATGKAAIPLTYSSVSMFNEGGLSLAPVATGTYPSCRWGLIDAEGNTVIECSWPCQWMYMMSEELVVTQKDGKMGLLKLTRPGAEELGLPISGSMARESGYDCEYFCSALGQLTLNWWPGKGETFLAAMYNAEGRLTGVEVLTDGRYSAWLDTTAAKVKLFWLGDDWGPLSEAATLWER